jgi:hypothetical protein
VRTEVASVVDRLRTARSLEWLRVIDDAALDQAVEHEAAAERVVAPYRWLLKAVGDEVRLTQAGYLPPAIVRAAMEELGWIEDWYGRANREIETPVQHLRESAQRFGLLRNQRGQLLMTKLGRELAEDPSKLYWHLASHLPDGRSESQRQAGVLYLLTIAAGRPPDDGLLATGMANLGWTTDGVAPVTPLAARNAARDTWWIFYWLRLASLRTSWNGSELPPSQQGRRLARAALIGPGRPDGAPASERRTASEQAVQLLVQLREIEPPIWRRLVVPESLTLRELHGVIQTAMGWEDYHLHMFDIGGVLYGDVEDFDSRPIGEEEAFSVAQAAAVSQQFSYEYDFGDGWTHNVYVEQTLTRLGPGTPHVIGGARACPPEDSGGSWGYEHLLEVLANPAHEEHNELLGWVGGAFDPEAFDLAQTNEHLELYDRHTRQRR